MSLLQVVHDFINSDSYSDCLIITHPDISVIRGVVTELRNEYEWPILDIGLQLSKKLLSIQPSKRSRQIPQIMDDMVGKFETNPIFCTNITLLFEPSLDLDPLALFLQLGRSHKIIVMWPGQSRNNGLSYAVPEHSHYRVWQKPDANIYSLMKSQG